MKEKNSPRLDWPTATIINVKVDQDQLVRRVTVQPHRRPGKSTTEAPRERAIHDLVLLKALQQEDKPSRVRLPKETEELTQEQTAHVIKAANLDAESLHHYEEPPGYSSRPPKRIREYNHDIRHI